MTDRDRELMQQALEALEISSDYSTKHTAETYYTPLIQTLRERLAQPEQDPVAVAHAIVAGALYDFMGWLTSRRTRLVLSDKDNAGPAADAIADFAKMRGLSLNEAQVQEWQEHLTTPPRRGEQEPVAGEYATCLEDGERVLIASVLPVGYGGNKTRTIRVVWPDGMDGVYTMFQFARLFSPVGELTTPPRREWVGLTKEEAKEISLANRPYVVDMIAALEARLKEKNA